MTNRRLRSCTDHRPDRDQCTKHVGPVDGGFILDHSSGCTAHRLLKMRSIRRDWPVDNGCRGVLHQRPAAFMNGASRLCALSHTPRVGAVILDWPLGEVPYAVCTESSTRKRSDYDLLHGVSKRRHRCCRKESTCRARSSIAAWVEELKKTYRTVNQH